MSHSAAPLRVQRAAGQYQTWVTGELTDIGSFNASSRPRPESRD